MNCQTAIMISQNAAKFTFLGCLGGVTLLSFIVLIVAAVDWAAASHSAIKLNSMSGMIFNVITAILIMAITGLGWYGGFMARRRMLALCGAVLILPTLGEVSNVRLLMRLDDEIDRTTLINDLEEKYKNYGIDPEVQKTIDTMHIFFQCCGPDTHEKMGKKNFPESCCKTLEDGKCKDPFKKGCADAMKEDMLSRLFIEGIFGTMLFIVCLATIVTAFMYRRILRRLLM